MAESLAEVLQCRPWNRALFTTYSLSLTFFESVILRLLRQSGCREIWVVADAQGYQSSLMERRSHGVGQEYHLVPIALPHGVFHPKCCYLEGPDGDLLAVGSGNLTFGGFGRNLEVMDVLSPESSPDCFREFGAFLNALRRRFRGGHDGEWKAWHPARPLAQPHQPTIDLRAGLGASDFGGFL